MSLKDLGMFHLKCIGMKTFLKQVMLKKKKPRNVKTLKAIAKTSTNSLTLNGQSITNKISMAKTFNLFLNSSPNLATNTPKPKNSFNSYLKNRAIIFFLNH